MKIQIAHAYSKPSNTDAKIVRLEELESVEASSCLEIDLGDTADFIPFHERSELYKVIVSKLRYGGRICLSGNDLYVYSQKIYEGDLSMDVANLGIFSGRLSADTMVSVVDKLKELSIQPEKYYYDPYFIYVIKGTRIQQ